MHRLVSSDTRTVESKGIWKAVRMYCVRIMGRSCFASTTLCASVKNFLNFSISPSLLPCARHGTVLLKADTVVLQKQQQIYSHEFIATVLSP